MFAPAPGRPRPLPRVGALEEDRAREHLRVAGRQLGLPDALVEVWAGGAISTARLLVTLWELEGSADARDRADTH